MCNLYRLAHSSDEVARIFRAAPLAGNVPGEIYPGWPGLVIEGGRLRSMIWGFPLHLTGKDGQRLKPKHVNNTRADKLHGPFWRSSFLERRCLVPMNAFAEPEGQSGHKTRTWVSVRDKPVFACAGLWRHSDEWGAVFSMVMTGPSPAMAHVHERMPVILHPDDYECWQVGTPDEALALCQPWIGELAIDRTAEPWVHR